MEDSLKYLFSLQDKIGKQAPVVAITSDLQLSRFARLQTQVNATDTLFREMGNTLGSMQARVATLKAEKEWIPASNTRAMRIYNTEITRLEEKMARLGSLGGAFKKWKQEILEAVPALRSLANPVGATVNAVKYIGQSALQFDRSMAQVSLSARLDPDGIATLKKRLVQIASENKTDILLAPAGFEKINARVNDTELSLTLLDASLKGVRAGMGDMDTVSETLVRTLSAVGKENASAQEVLDTLATAGRIGGTGFSDFATFLPELISGASSLGFGFREVAGTFAYMTGKGQSAQAAAASIQNAFTALSRSDVQSKMAQNGIPVAGETGKMRSSIAIIRDLQTAMKGMNEGEKTSFLKQLGLDDASVQSTFAVLTSDIDGLQGSLDAVTGSAGATEKAIGASKNGIRTATETWTAFKNIGTRIGISVLPLITSALEIVEGAVNKVVPVTEKIVAFFSAWSNALQNGNPLVWTLTYAIGGLAAVLATAFVYIHAVTAATKAKLALDALLAGANQLLTGTQQALNITMLACPLFWIVAAIAAVTGAVIYCWNHFEGFRMAVLGVWEVMQAFGNSLWNAIITPISKILEGIRKIGGAFSALMKGEFKEAAAQAKEGFTSLSEGIVNANLLAVAYHTGKNGNYAEAWERGKQKGRDSWAASQQAKEETAPSTATAFSSPGQSGLSHGFSVPAAIPGAPVVSGNLSPQQALPGYEAPAGAPGNSSGNRYAAAAVPAYSATPVTQASAGEKSFFLEDLLKEVRKIAAVLTMPAALSVPMAAQASPFTADMNGIRAGIEMQGATDPFGNPLPPTGGKNIQVGKVCDQLAFHIQNSDGRNIEHIKTEIIHVLNELCDGYQS